MTMDDIDLDLSFQHYLQEVAGFDTGLLEGEDLFPSDMDGGSETSARSWMRRALQDYNDDDGDFTPQRQDWLDLSAASLPTHVDRSNAQTPPPATAESKQSRGPLSPFSPLARSRRRPRPASHDASPLSAENNADNNDLSLIPCRNVSIVVRVHLSKQSHDEQQQDARLCLFPLIPDIPPTSDNLRSPTSATLQAASIAPTNDLVLVNPSAFGKYIPSEVTIETARLVANVANIQSEDWARRYRFDEVVWPTFDESDDLTCPSLVKLAQSMANDAVLRGKSSTCLAIGASDSGKTRDLFGDAIEQARGNVVPERFGLLGLILASILEQLPEHAVCTLSLLEIVDEEVLRDLLASDHIESQLRLKMQHPDNKGAIVQNLTEVPMDSLTNLDHLMRKAFHSKAALRARKGEGPRGHVMATISLWENGVQYDLANLARCTTIQLVDLAGGSDSSTTVNARSTRRMASFRKSVSGLRGVLRSLLLQAADGSLTNPISFRECTLTKLLQRPLEKQHTRTVVLAAVCSRSESYEKTLQTLNYVNRLLIRPGKTAQSPFDTSHRVTLLSGNSPEELMSPPLGADGIFDRYGDDDAFLQNVLSDPRQRLAKLMKPHSSTHATMTPTKLQLTTENEDSYEPYDYMQIDPSTINGMHSSGPWSLAQENHDNQESSTMEDVQPENRDTDEQRYTPPRTLPSPTRTPTFHRFQNGPDADERKKHMQENGMSKSSSLSDEEYSLTFQIEQQLADANDSRFEMESFQARQAEPSKPNESTMAILQVDQASFIVKTVVSESDESTPSCQPVSASTVDESVKLSLVPSIDFTHETERHSHDADDDAYCRQSYPLEFVSRSATIRLTRASVTRGEDSISRSTSENDSEALGKNDDFMSELDNAGQHGNQTETSISSMSSKAQVIANLREIQSHSKDLSMSRAMRGKSPVSDKTQSRETNLAPTLHSKLANELSTLSSSSSLQPHDGTESFVFESVVGAANVILNPNGSASFVSANEFERKYWNRDEIRRVAPSGHKSGATTRNRTSNASDGVNGSVQSMSAQAIKKQTQGTKLYEVGSTSHTSQWNGELMSQQDRVESDSNILPKARLRSPPLSQSNQKSHTEELDESREVSHRKETTKSIQTCITDQSDSHLRFNDYLDEIQLLEGAVDQIRQLHSGLWESSATSLQRLRMYRQTQLMILQDADEARKKAEAQAETFRSELQRQSHQRETYMDQVSELKNALTNALDHRAAVEKIAEEAISDQDRLEAEISAAKTEIGRLRDQSEAQIVEYNLVLQTKELLSIKLDAKVTEFNKLQLDHEECKHMIDDLKKDAKNYSDERRKFGHESDLYRRRMNDMSRLEIDHADLRQSFEAAIQEVARLREENAEIVVAFERHKGKSLTKAEEWESQRSAMDDELKALKAEFALIQHRNTEEYTALRRVMTQLQGERSNLMAQVSDAKKQLKELDDERRRSHCSAEQEAANAAKSFEMMKHHDEELQRMKEDHAVLMRERESDKARTKQMHHAIVSFQTKAKDKILAISNQNEALKTALEATRNDVNMREANQTALLQRDRAEFGILNNEIEMLCEKVNVELSAKRAAKRKISLLQSKLEDHQEELHSTRRELRRLRSISTESHTEVEDCGETDENGLSEIKAMPIDDNQVHASLSEIQGQVDPVFAKHLQYTTSRSGNLLERKVKHAQTERVLEDGTQELGTSLAAIPGTASSVQLERLRYEQMRRRQAEEVAAAMAARAKWSLEKRNEEIMHLKVRLSSLADEKELEITKLRSSLHAMGKQMQWTQVPMSSLQDRADCDFWKSDGSEQGRSAPSFQGGAFSGHQ